MADAGQNVVEETDSESGYQAGAAEEDTHLPEAEPGKNYKPQAAEQSPVPEQLPLEGEIDAEEKAMQDKMRWADEMDKGEEGAAAAGKLPGTGGEDENATPANQDNAAAKEAARRQQKSACRFPCTFLCLQRNRSCTCCRDLALLFVSEQFWAVRELNPSCLSTDIDRHWTCIMLYAWVNIVQCSN